MKKIESKEIKPQLVGGLKELHLPTMRESFATAAEQARQEALSYEQYLLELELEAFLSLCGERKTQERIAFTLKTGKPLRN